MCVRRVGAGAALPSLRVRDKTQIAQSLMALWCPCSLFRFETNPSWIFFPRCHGTVTKLEIDLNHVIPPPAIAAVIILLRRAVLQHLIVALADWKNAKDEEGNPHVVKTIMYLVSHYYCKIAECLINFI